MSVRFWRSAGRFAASYKALFMHVTCDMYRAKGDIGMANHEKQVEQEAAYPIPISLYNCYRTVRHEKRYQM